MESDIFNNPAIYFEAKAAEASITLDALCNRAGISRSTLTRWKNNSSAATFTSINKLQKALKKLSKSHIGATNNGKKRLVNSV